MLQNRVDPFGELIRTPARGSFMGNRGLLHNDKKVIIRPFRLKAWITCLLEFKQRHREIMSPGLYTELFFLDEATAFAAGHRPCAECRRADFVRFKHYWLEGNCEYEFDEKTSVQKIDEIIHSERMLPDLSKFTYQDELSSLPDGVFVHRDGHPHLVWEDEMYQWSPFGYEKAERPLATIKLEVLTPRSVVNAFRAGYKPVAPVLPGGGHGNDQPNFSSTDL